VKEDFETTGHCTGWKGAKYWGKVCSLVDRDEAMPELFPASGPTRTATESWVQCLIID
jgi:hypothetical protein